MMGKAKGMMIGIISLIVTIIAVFFILGGTSNAIVDSADNVSGSGLPLASLFSSNGIILTIIMLIVFVGLVYAGFSMFGGKK